MDVVQAVLRGNGTCQCLNAVAFSRMMAARQKCHAALPSVMRLRLGNFSCNKCLYTSRNRLLEKALTTAGAPRQSLDGHSLR